MTIHVAKPEHEIAYQDLAAWMKKHSDQHGLSSMELLAVFANALGKVIALQDQRKVTPQMAMEVITTNMQMGNQQAIEQFDNTEGSA